MLYYYHASCCYTLSGLVRLYFETTKYTNSFVHYEACLGKNAPLIADAAVELVLAHCWNWNGACLVLLLDPQPFHAPIIANLLIHFAFFFLSSVFRFPFLSCICTVPETLSKVSPVLAHLGVF